MAAEVRSLRCRVLLQLFGLVLVSLLLVDAGTAWARAGGGGSRGSRSYSAPARPTPSPAAPASPMSPARPSVQPAPSQPQRPGFLGSLMGGIAGFALGGLIGSLLFGGMGHGFGGGIGLLEILLIGGGVFLLLRAFRGRQAAPEPAYAGAGATADSAGDASQNEGGVATVAAAAPSELDRGIGYIRQMDPGFDPAVFAQWAQRVFVDVQEGIGKRDLSLLSHRLTPQENARLQGQCDRLRDARQTNRVEQIQFERTEVTEAWQENGQDWVTVYVAASLIDYTLDDTTGELVDGSKTPQDIEEYWTFTRAVGSQAWRLSAIQTS